MTVLQEAIFFTFIFAAFLILIWGIFTKNK